MVKIQKKNKAFLKFINGDYLFGIVNYELVRSMSDMMKEFHYDVIIADEAHRLKNRVLSPIKLLMHYLLHIDSQVLAHHFKTT